MCEKCMYRKNCQFLATHKKDEVAGCTAFVSEEDYRANIKAESIKEFAERLCDGRVSNDPIVIAAKCLLKEMKDGPKQ